MIEDNDGHSPPQIELMLAEIIDPKKNWGASVRFKYKHKQDRDPYLSPQYRVVAWRYSSVKR